MKHLLFLLSALLLISHSAKSQVMPDATWLKAPNSYIFDPKASPGEGLLIPVKKAYVMWDLDASMGGSPITPGVETAEVLWEDNHGLIHTSNGYELSLIGSGETAKIQVNINKAMEGNAVIAYKVDGTIRWSWHVWVTDDPTQGSTYKHYPVRRRIGPDPTDNEPIPDSDWGWMDRNLGALSGSITGDDWNQNSGLLYQWGRKDPIPPLVTRGNDFYEVSGSIGRVRHRNARHSNGSVDIVTLHKKIKKADAELNHNIRESVKNPLSLIYVYNNDLLTEASYIGSNPQFTYNWFGRKSGLTHNKLSEVNLWSDNSKGKTTNNPNSDKVYKDKSPYDPCPNGWRIPSMLQANTTGTGTYDDQVRVDFSPFGPMTSMTNHDFIAQNHHIIKPTNTGMLPQLADIKVYPNIGFDMNQTPSAMGVFPGNGQILHNSNPTLSQNNSYTDQHHVALWTATMGRFFDGTPANQARSLFMIPDKGQPDVPDPSFSSVTGRYHYYPMQLRDTREANACRCIKDPNYVVNDYDFPTEFAGAGNIDHRYDAIDSPNSYLLVANNNAQTVELPISKAIAMVALYDHYYSAGKSTFMGLKTKVLWTDNHSLVETAYSIDNYVNPLFTCNSTITVNIRPNETGNAVISLHRNNDLDSPPLWSWHIWVTADSAQGHIYTTESGDDDVDNYVNYIKPGAVMRTEIMDRNLGATYALSSLPPGTVSTTSPYRDTLEKSLGLLYQWGRPSPLPVFREGYNGDSRDIYVGDPPPNASPIWSLVHYDIISESDYFGSNSDYLQEYNDYAADAGVTASDIVPSKIEKITQYSSRHPLTYMTPSNWHAVNSSGVWNTLGTDWISDESNLSWKRWGRGTKKSPFDPCPRGWRIPDLTDVSVGTTSDFGRSPWYKSQIDIDVAKDLSQFYDGATASNSSSDIVATIFSQAGYNTGVYPHTGVLGGRYVVQGESGPSTAHDLNYERISYWTAALTSHGRGRPISFSIYPNTNKFQAFDDNNDPYFAAPCRCVKININENTGEEEGPILKIYTPNEANEDTLSTEIQKLYSKTYVYPNPSHDVLNIETDLDLTEYVLLDMLGTQIRRGRLSSQPIDISRLTPGAYVLRLTGDEDLTATFKIIKQ